MRIFTILIMGLFLTACGADVVKNRNESESIENKAVQDEFQLKLKSEKPKYKVGERLNITADLTYTGEEDIEIGHGGSWIFLNTINITKGYQFEAAMIQPHIVTAMTPNEPIIEQYGFSGSNYFKGKEGNPYTDEEFEQMASMNFPPGKYKIEGFTDFHIIGEEPTYNIKSEIFFEVIE